MSVELEAHTGLSDRDLAEFVVDLAQESPNSEVFNFRLKENGAEFRRGFVENIYQFVAKSLPQSAAGAAARQPSAAKLEEKFPALAIPDKKDFFGISPDELEKIIGGDVDREEREARWKEEGFVPIRVKLEADGSTHPASPPPDAHRHSHHDDRDRRSYGQHDDRDRRRADEGRRGKDERGRDGKAVDLEVGGVYRGRVTGITTFGCFVSMEGVRGRKEGLVHISQIIMSGRVADVNDVVQKGQPVWVKVSPPLCGVT